MRNYRHPLVVMKEELLLGFSFRSGNTSGDRRCLRGEKSEDSARANSHRNEIGKNSIILMRLRVHPTDMDPIRASPCRPATTLDAYQTGRIHRVCFIFWVESAPRSLVSLEFGVSRASMIE